MAKLVPQKELLKTYFVTRALPTTWCPGCGCGIITQALVRAIHQSGIDKNKFAFVTGIGCSGFIPRYIDFDELHVTHGRAPAYGTGLKLARPDLTVILIQGDGDVISIGGNHIIHAARRNIDLTAIVSNNYIYGRTGGQYSPTTPKGDYATTAPYGLAEPAFDLCKIIESSGASFVARGTVAFPLQLATMIEKGIKHKGFSFIEIVNPCPVNYGRRNPNRMGVTGPNMMKWLRDHIIPLEKTRGMSPKELEDKLVTGIFVEKDYPEYLDEYEKIRAKSYKESGEI
jgi:2-oxoglutarate ferredoxin oxidoreductase subunit beta